MGQIGHLFARFLPGREPLEVLEAAHDETLEAFIPTADDPHHLLVVYLVQIPIDEVDRRHLIQWGPDLMADEGQEVALQLIEDPEPAAGFLEVTRPRPGDV